jgi:hypothetical protein
MKNNAMSSDLSSLIETS